MNITKKCTRCTEVKPSTEFYKNVSMKDGLSHYCKPCDKKRKKEQKLGLRPRRGKRTETIPSAFKVNTKRLVLNYSSKARKIEEGKLKDDYTNHMLSHFGFYDVAHDLDYTRRQGMNSIEDPKKMVVSKCLR